MLVRFIALCFVLASCAGEIDDDAKAGDGLAELTDADDGADVDGGGAPRARVCAEGATTKGIDVSKWQGDINWTSRLKTAAKRRLEVRRGSSMAAL